MASEQSRTTEEIENTIIRNLAMMLRRMIWQARQEAEDTSMKTLAGKAEELLKSYGLKGSLLRD